jgi:putative chitinase
MITLELLAALFPKTPVPTCARFVDPLNETCKRYSIDTPLRQAAFLAQIGHQSGGLIFTKENLNYSDVGLLSTFKKYFTDITAAQYSRKPEMIANRVYANRMGNGDEKSGDGWKFRGRGLIQITGHDNYARFATDNSMALDDAAVYLESDMGAAISAGWYWDCLECNKYVDIHDFDGLSDVINKGRKTTVIGDANGYANRVELYAKAKQLLGVIL